MPGTASRPNRISACCRRFAGREALTPRSTSDQPQPLRRQKLTNGQSLPYKSIVLVGGFAVDGLVFEFMGLAMLALCVIVLAVPSGRRPARRVGDS
jgi:hypothetical protein